MRSCGYYPRSEEDYKNSIDRTIEDRKAITPDLKKKLFDLDNELHTCLSEVYVPMADGVASGEVADIRNSIVEKFGFYRYDAIQKSITEYHSLVDKEKNLRSGLAYLIECKLQREQYEKEKAEEWAKNPPVEVKLGRWQRFCKILSNWKMKLKEFPLLK